MVQGGGPLSVQWGVDAGGAGLQRQGALTRRGQEVVQRQFLADVVAHAQPRHARYGQQDGVELAIGGAPQPGVDISAQHLDLKVGSQGQGLSLTAQTGGAQTCAQRQVGETGEVAADEGVAGVLALGNGGDAQALGLFGGHILHRVDGDVDPAGQQGLLDLLGEQGLAADFQQAAILHPVAGGDDLDQGDCGLDLGFRARPGRGRWRAASCRTGRAPA